MKINDCLFLFPFWKCILLPFPLTFNVRRLHREFLIMNATEIKWQKINFWWCAQASKALFLVCRMHLPYFFIIISALLHTKTFQIETFSRQFSRRFAYKTMFFYFLSLLQFTLHVKESCNKYCDCNKVLIEMDDMLPYWETLLWLSLECR